MQVDMDTLIRDAESQGWRHSRTAKNHHQFYAPNKHDIVVMSGTPSDRNSHMLGVKQMIKAGFVDHSGQYGGSSQNGVMSEQLANVLHTEPEPKPETKPVVRARGSITAAIIEYMHTHPNRVVAIEELFSGVKIRCPWIARETFGVSVAPLVKRGEFARYEYGSYIYRQAIPEPVAAPPPPAPAPEPPPPPPVPVIPERIIEEASEVTLEDDIERLNQALAALAVMEEVVRRNRAVLVKFRELKEMLDKLGLKL